MSEKQNMNITLSGPFGSRIRAKTERQRMEKSFERRDVLDMRSAVRESSDRPLVGSPSQLAQDIFTQMGIVESMTDNEAGPDLRVMRSADRKINYNWKLLWQLALGGDQEAQVQVNLLQNEMIEYKKIRTKYLLKKVRTNLYAATFVVSTLLSIQITNAGSSFTSVALLIAGTILAPYFILVQPFIKHKAHKEALGKYS